MRILSINIKNLNSLKSEVHIALDQPPISTSGLFAITGDTGAGKSTILDAITLALYGKVHRNKDVREVLSYGAPECLAEVEFQVKENIFRAKWNLWRARGKSDGNILGPNRELSKWNQKKNEFEIVAEKVREVDEQVEAITGLDYDRFSRSVVLSQGDFAAFLKSNEKDRSDLLERITGTEIYSEYSKAAFQKHKEEENKLQDLNSQIEHLKLLDKEAVKTLKSELKILKKESTANKKAIDENRKQIQWLDQIEKLESRISKLESETQNLEEQKAASKSDFERLLLHNKTIPFHSKIEKQNDLTKELSALNEQIESLQSTSIETNKKLEGYEKTASEKTEQYSIFKKVWVEKSSLIDQVIKLDTAIKENEQPLVKLKNNLLSDQEQEVSKKAQLNKVEQDLQQLLVEEKDLKDWLKVNKSKASIVDDLPQVRQLYQNLRSFYKRKEDLSKERSTVEKEIKKLKTQESKLEKLVKEANQALTTVLDDFKKAIPDNFALSRSELLNKITNDIDQLTLNNKSLQELKLLNDQYQESLIEYDQHEGKLENLKQEESVVNKRIMTAIETVDMLKQQLDFKKQVYEEQLMIANYEQDRTKLKEGEECPLCFSTSHPFRNGKFKPYTNQAKKELDQVTKQYELIYTDYRSLLNRQKDLEVQIENLAGNELKELGGDLQNKFHKILSLEERITQIAPELTVEDFAMARQSIINLKLNNFEEDIRKMKTSRQKLIKLDSSLEKNEAILKKHEAEKVNLDLQIVKYEEQFKILNKQTEEADQQFTKEVSELNKLLKTYDRSFDISTGKETSQYLETLKNNFEAKLKLESELKNKINLSRQEIKQLKELIDSLNKKSKELQADVAKQEALLNNKKEERIKLFGEEDPTEVKLSFQNKLSEMEQEIVEDNKILNQLKLVQQTINTRINESEARVKKLQSNLEKINAQLLSDITKYDFESLEQVLNSILSEEDALFIKNKKEQLEKQEVQIQQDLTTTNKDLEQELKLALTKEERDSLESNSNELEEVLQNHQQQIGAINEKLIQNDQQKEVSKKLLVQIDQQRAEYNRWAKLNDIIGQADGKKFRVFAQGLTLKKLAVLANQHLRQLNGRYIIHKRSDADLSLEIIDTYQADNIRSMNTLSGGESFLVSLSLALGLSDLAGRNTNIRSLFIDEGFGTLDESTLDLAISTLENLQSAGKTIGIISHVKELKERISTQIMIHKTGSGFSRIEVSS